MDPILFIAESAVLATPALVTWTYASRGRRRLRQALREPLFWDGGQPVSLATIHLELNGEGDLEGELKELVGSSGPLDLGELERAVAQLQGNPMLAKKMVLELATSAALKGTMPRADAPTGVAGMAAAVALAERLAARQEEQGFFGFIASLNAERPHTETALLPIEALMPGGFAIGPPPDGEPTLTGPSGSSVLGMLQAIGLGREGEWLPGVMRAVGDLVRDRQVKKARDGYHKALSVLGRAVGDSLRRRTPAGQQLRRNAYSPLDAYRNLATRLNAHPVRRQRANELLVPSVASALHDELRRALGRAMAIVGDKCANLERTLVGRNGEAFAGELVFRHREGLLAGIEPIAYPMQAVELARDAYRAAQAGDAAPGHPDPAASGQGPHGPAAPGTTHVVQIHPDPGT